MCPSCGRTGDADFCPFDGALLISGQAARDPAKGLVGRVLLGRYRLLEVIGCGGMGRVYRAEQVGMGRTVAVKVLRPDPAAEGAGQHSALHRFQREVEAATRPSAAARPSRATRPWACCANAWARGDQTAPSIAALPDGQAVIAWTGDAPEAAGTDVLFLRYEDHCFDGLDNDGDGTTDAGDPDCDGRIAKASPK